MCDLLVLVIQTSLVSICVKNPLLSNLIHFQGATHFLPWLVRLWIFEIYHRSLKFFVLAVIVTKNKRDFSLCSTLWFKNLLSRQLMNEQMFSLVRMLLHEWNENICGFMQSFIFKTDLSCSLFWFFFLVKSSGSSYCHFWIKQ